MKILTTIDAVRKELRRRKKLGNRIGFVPTMGALHKGHASLLRSARRENDCVVLSIFVNPTQFAPSEDYRRYPRPKNKDCMLAKQENVDIIFYPSVKEIYPRSFLTEIHVREMSDPLCGRFRPGHFDGVALIVAKLLNIVAPNTLYLGQKDAQQCAVLKQFVRDLNVPVTVRICPTVREKDGLAMSSRNQYLSAKDRRQAAVLYQALSSARSLIRKGERNAATVTAHMRAMIRRGTSARIQYLECVDAETLMARKRLSGKILIAMAVWFKRTRLIDNIIVHAKM